MQVGSLATGAQRLQCRLSPFDAVFPLRTRYAVPVLAANAAPRRSRAARNAGRRRAGRMRLPETRRRGAAEWSEAQAALSNAEETADQLTTFHHASM
jgi:hypothetical protein